MRKAINFFLTLFLSFTFCIPQAKATVPVIDYVAIGKWVEQIQKMIVVIEQLKTLRGYAELDHENLGSTGWANYLKDFNKLFDDVIEVIDSYQEGGMLGQLDRLDEVYFPYHEGWESELTEDYLKEANPLLTSVRKQILWTKIQFKHAATVAGKVRESLPKTQEELDTALQKGYKVDGLMQSIKVGHEIAGIAARSLENLNVQMSELIQAQAGEGLEKNMRQGIINNRIADALKDWDEDNSTRESVPANPFGAY